MKLRKLLLPFFLSLGLASCDISLKSVTGVSVEIEQKSRVEGDSFLTSEFNAIVEYSNNTTKKVSFSDFGEYLLSASYYSPISEKSKRLDGDFVLEEVGTYTIEVSYNPTSKYQYKSSGNAYFVVEKKIVPATSMTLSSDSLSLCKGESGSISYSILPEDSTTKTPTFVTNDNNIATVDEEGNVTAIEEGQCIITATADSISKDVLVTVTPAQTIDYVFTSQKFTTDKGNWNYSVEGSSMDSRLNRGVGISEETLITSPLSFDSITSIKFDCSTGSGPYVFGGPSEVEVGTIETYVGETKIGSGVLNKYNSSFRGDYDVSNNSGEVKINILPEESANAKIYFRSVSITTDALDIYPTSISLSGNASVGIGERDKVSISYSPMIANKRNIEWSSSNEEILTVGQDGSVYGHKEGTAIVTAKAKVEEGSVQDSFSISVVKIPVSSVELNASTIEIYQKKSKQIVPTIYPSNASNKNVSYESSNPSVATVDASGNITGVAIGECTVTCKSADDPTKIATCVVKILEQPALVAQYMSTVVNDYTTNTYYEVDSAPSLGTTKFLVIPVWFTDSSTFISSKDKVREDIQKVYFGSESETGWNSVKTYYETESDGKLTIEGSVSEWYECGKSYSTYNYDSNDSDNITVNLVKNATDWYFSNHSSDSRKNYDSDGDGYLDGVILIYGCPDHTAFEAKQNRFSKTNYGDNLWAYTFWIQNRSLKNVNSPGPNAYFWASYDFMYNETTSLSRTGKSNYGSGNTSHCNVDAHIFIHEMGHIFGLEDYYDYSNYYKPAGGFSMQDFNVGGHDPFSCLALGWAKAYVPIENSVITLNPFQSSHEVILLSPSWNAYNSPFDEYLLLELYTPTGLNKFDTDYQYATSSPRGVSGVGIRLWHVDARLIKYVSGNPVASPTYTNTVSGCKLMMSNTYYSSSTTGYISPLGRSYADYNILQLIRNSTTATYKPNDYLRDTYLFKNGSSFKTDTYKKQFVQSGKLNSGVALGWEFSVSISGSGASSVAKVTVNKI